jgi:hypothetical protein
MAPAVGMGWLITRPHPESNGPAIKIDRISRERDLIFSSQMRDIIPQQVTIPQT